MMFGLFCGIVLGAGWCYSRGGGGAVELDGSSLGVCEREGAVGGYRKDLTQ